MLSNNAIKSEFLVQLLKPSTYFVIAVFVLLQTYICGTGYNELLFLIMESKIDSIISSNFPPAVNCCILMTVLTGGTIFTLLGGLIIRYDYNNKCVLMKATTYGYQNVLNAKVVWGLFFSGVIAIISTVTGYIFQLYINFKQPQYAYNFSFSDIWTLLSKILAVIIVLNISYMLGMFIGNCIHNVGLTVILCLVFDQVILSKSWLYTAYVHRQFSDSVLMVKTPPANFTNYSSVVITLIIFCMVVIAYFFSTKVYRISKE